MARARARTPTRARTRARAPSPLLRRLRAAFAAAGDPERARGAQAYMKSAMPFHGVAMPEVRRICRAAFEAHAVESAAGWRDDVLALFRGARFREEWYAAVELCLDRRARAFQTPAAMPMYEEIIVGAAWWDVVDTVAAHGVGPIVAAHPAVMRPMMRAWSRDENLWRRRAAILCQIRRRGAADRALLQDCLAPSLGSKEFFLRKAVGWALREVAWDDPTWVVRYVRAHARELAPLSKREALKNVIEQGLARDIP